MTLVLSMNPFCDHSAPDADPALPQFQPIWESERCSKSCVSTPSPLECAVEQLAKEPHCRRLPDHVTTSRIAYFKRKYVEDEDPHLCFRNYCQTVAPVLEERAHVLRLSLEKMRFIDDPEAFLRRSVLVNNLLRRLRAEILLQSNWCFPPGPTPGPSPSPACPWEVPQSGRPCFSPPGAPYRKRFRLVRGEAPGECLPACCCCLYGGRYLHLPFSIYEEEPSSSPSSSSSSSSSPSFPQCPPTEGGERRPDTAYPTPDSPEAGSPRDGLDAKERPRGRDRTTWEGAQGHKKGVTRQERNEKSDEVLGRSRWASDPGNSKQEVAPWCPSGRKL
ncbi:hypothetical protein GJAV_G00002780 [Gymnothorax javanicus]|nr:hypothetical protein GJAV_G00002780 [Gymnothorax javanicus]